MRAAPDYFLLNTLHSNSLNSTMTVTTLLQGGLYSMGCPDVLIIVAGCVTLPLANAGQLVQQYVASSYFWVPGGLVLAGELRG